MLECQDWAVKPCDISVSMTRAGVVLVRRGALRLLWRHSRPTAPMFMSKDGHVKLFGVFASTTTTTTPAPRSSVPVGVDDDNIRRAVAAGGVEAVVEALRAHSADAVKQEQNCWTLGNLCCLDDENRRRFGAVGGVEVAVEALKAHRDNADVQGSAFGAVWCLCMDNDDNVSRAKELGAVGLVEAALRNHPNQVMVQEHGRSALDVLTVK